jgi:lipoprotein-anchoring transpeptidase ErfK/SrfK
MGRGAKATLFCLCLGLLLCFPAQSGTQRSATRAKRARANRAKIERPAPSALKVEDINNPSNAPALGPEAERSAIVRAQILLDRQCFSAGEIDGHYGTNLMKTIAAYQASHNLPKNPQMGPETWSALSADNAPVLVNYTIVAEDVAGPFYQIPSDMMEQAKLPALGYSSPQEALGERVHCSPKLLQELNPGKALDKPGEQILVPNVVVPPPPGPAATVVVSKSDSSVTALDEQGHVLGYYSATIGSEHDPLPVGKWKILGVRRNPVFHYNPGLFWDADPKHQKAEIKAGPNNPVGVVWISLSKEHYGIHGSPEPSRIGHTESHGCIRLTNWDALELAGMVKPNTPAVLTE